MVHGDRFGKRDVSPGRAGTGTRRADIRRLLVAGTAILGLLGACERGPDTTGRPELEPLYEFLYEEAEAQFGRDLRASSAEADRLARDRLVNAANSLADEAASNPQPTYQIELPHLNVPEEPPDWDTPVDFRVTVTAEQLVELGVGVP